MKKIIQLIIILLLVGAIFLPLTASASGFEDDKVIFGSNYTLREGETLNGDLIVFGGNITLQESSTINGDAVVFGGNVTSNGTINGNLVGLGGIVILEENSLVQGDLTMVGSSFDQSPDAVITGNILTEESMPFEIDLPERGFFNGDFRFPTFNQLPFVSASWFVFQILIWTGLAVLISLFVEKQVPIINQAAFDEPVISFVVGFGVAVLAPFVLLALFLTILLSPISLLGFVALIATWVLGLVSLSIEVGRRLMKALKQTMPLPLQAGIGMFIITLIFNGVSQLNICLGLVPKFTLGAWMIGAVILTRYGTHSYPEGKDKPTEEVIPDSTPDQKIPEDFPDSPPINATQAAIELAEAEGIDLASLTGTGAKGRIILNDVRKAIKNKN